jgi:hypothetical protein
VNTESDRAQVADQPAMRAPEQMAEAVRAHNEGDGISGQDARTAMAAIFYVNAVSGDNEANSDLIAELVARIRAQQRKDQDSSGPTHPGERLRGRQ